MNRHLEQLCADSEPISATAQHIAKLEDTDLRQYHRGRERIEELRKELESRS